METGKLLICSYCDHGGTDRIEGYAQWRCTDPEAIKGIPGFHGRVECRLTAITGGCSRFKAPVFSDTAKPR